MNSPPQYRRLPTDDFELHDHKELSLSYYARRIPSLPSESSQSPFSPEPDTKESSYTTNAILILVYSLTCFILLDALCGRSYTSRIFLASGDSKPSSPSLTGDWTSSSTVLQDILSSGSCFTSASRSVFCYIAQSPDQAEGVRDQSKPSAVEITFAPQSESASSPPASLHRSQSHRSQSLPPFSNSFNDSEAFFDQGEEAIGEEETAESQFGSSLSFVSFLSHLLRSFSVLGLQNAFDVSDLDLEDEQYEMDIDGTVIRLS